VVKSILIVDDNPSVRHFLRSYLESQPGFQVCGEAVDGMDAIEKSRDLHPDLIVLDFAMPRMNGLDAADCDRFCPMCPSLCSHCTKAP
jgi:chemotaxis response regulator CheB